MSLRIEIIELNGEVREITVSQVFYLLTCHYSRCQQTFRTDNIDRKYCGKPSHQVKASVERNLGVKPALSVTF